MARPLCCLLLLVIPILQAPARASPPEALQSQEFLALKEGAKSGAQPEVFAKAKVRWDEAGGQFLSTESGRPLRPDELANLWRLWKEAGAGSRPDSPADLGALARRLDGIEQGLRSVKPGDQVEAGAELSRLYDSMSHSDLAGLAGQDRAAFGAIVARMVSAREGASSEVQARLSDEGAVNRFHQNLVRDPQLADLMRNLPAPPEWRSASGNALGGAVGEPEGWRDLFTAAGHRRLERAGLIRRQMDRAADLLTGDPLTGAKALLERRPDGRDRAAQEKWLLEVKRVYEGDGRVAQLKERMGAAAHGEGAPALEEFRQRHGKFLQAYARFGAASAQYGVWMRENLRELPDGTAFDARVLNAMPESMPGHDGQAPARKASRRIAGQELAGVEYDAKGGGTCFVTAMPAGAGFMPVNLTYDAKGRLVERRSVLPPEASGGKPLVITEKGSFDEEGELLNGSITGGTGQGAGKLLAQASREPAKGGGTRRVSKTFTPGGLALESRQEFDARGRPTRFDRPAIDPRTGKPGPGRDIWELREGRWRHESINERERTRQELVWGETDLALIDPERPELGEAPRLAGPGYYAVSKGGERVGLRLDLGALRGLSPAERRKKLRELVDGRFSIDFPLWRSQDRGALVAFLESVLEGHKGPRAPDIFVDAASAQLHAALLGESGAVMRRVARWELSPDAAVKTLGLSVYAGGADAQPDDIPMEHYWGADAKHVFSAQRRQTGGRLSGARLEGRTTYELHARGGPGAPWQRQWARSKPWEVVHSERRLALSETLRSMESGLMGAGETAVGYAAYEVGAAGYLVGRQVDRLWSYSERTGLAYLERRGDARAIARERHRIQVNQAYRRDKLDDAAEWAFANLAGTPVAQAMNPTARESGAAGSDDYIMNAPDAMARRAADAATVEEKLLWAGAAAASEAGLQFSVGAAAFGPLGAIGGGKDAGLMARGFNRAFHYGMLGMAGHGASQTTFGAGGIIEAYRDFSADPNAGSELAFYRSLNHWSAATLPFAAGARLSQRETPETRAGQAAEAVVKGSVRRAAPDPAAPESLPAPRSAGLMELRAGSQVSVRHPRGGRVNAEVVDVYEGGAWVEWSEFGHRMSMQVSLAEVSPLESARAGASSPRESGSLAGAQRAPPRAALKDAGLTESESTRVLERLGRLKEIVEDGQTTQAARDILLDAEVKATILGEKPMTIDVQNLFPADDAIGMVTPEVRAALKHISPDLQLVSTEKGWLLFDRKAAARAMQKGRGDPALNFDKQLSHILRPDGTIDESAFSRVMKQNGWFMEGQRGRLGVLLGYPVADVKGFLAAEAGNPRRQFVVIRSPSGGGEIGWMRPADSVPHPESLAQARRYAGVLKVAEAQLNPVSESGAAAAEPAARGGVPERGLSLATGDLKGAARAPPSEAGPLRRSPKSAAKVSEGVVLANAAIPDFKARVAAAAAQLGLTPKQAAAVAEAHDAVPCAVGGCTWPELRAKARIMRAAGLDESAVRAAIERGLAGRARPAAVGEKVAVPRSHGGYTNGEVARVLPDGRLLVVFAEPGQKPVSKVVPPEGLLPPLAGGLADVRGGTPVCIPLADGGRVNAQVVSISGEHAMVAGEGLGHRVAALKIALADLDAPQERPVPVLPESPVARELGEGQNFNRTPLYGNAESFVGDSRRAIGLFNRWWSDGSQRHSLRQLLVEMHRRYVEHDPERSHLAGVYRGGGRPWENWRGFRTRNFARDYYGLEPNADGAVSLPGIPKEMSPRFLMRQFTYPDMGAPGMQETYHKAMEAKLSEFTRLAARMEEMRKSDPRSRDSPEYQSLEREALDATVDFGRIAAAFRPFQEGNWGLFGPMVNSMVNRLGYQIQHPGYLDVLFQGATEKSLKPFFAQAVKEGRAFFPADGYDPLKGEIRGPPEAPKAAAAAPAARAPPGGPVIIPSRGQSVRLGGRDRNGGSALIANPEGPITLRAGETVLRVSQADGRWVLQRVSGGAGKPRALEAGRPFSVGRAEGRYQMPADGKMSGLHMEITITPEGVLIRDLGSRNGTEVSY